MLLVKSTVQCIFNGYSVLDSLPGDIKYILSSTSSSDTSHTSLTVVVDFILVCDGYANVDETEAGPEVCSVVADGTEVMRESVVAVDDGTSCVDDVDIISEYDVVGSTVVTADVDGVGDVMPSVVDIDSKSEYDIVESTDAFPEVDEVDDETTSIDKVDIIYKKDIVGSTFVTPEVDEAVIAVSEKDGINAFTVKLV